MSSSYLKYLIGFKYLWRAGDGLEEGRSPEDMELDAYTSGYDALEDGYRSEWDNPILVGFKYLWHAAAMMI